MLLRHGRGPARTHARSLNIAQLQQGILLQQLAHHLLVLARIAIFDEWVGNEDRHEGNILLSPTGVPLVIDHKRTRHRRRRRAILWLYTPSAKQPS